MKKFVFIIGILIATSLANAFDIRDFFIKPRGAKSSYSYKVTKNINGTVTTFNFKITYEITDKGYLLTLYKDSSSPLVHIFYDSELNPIKQKVANEKKWIEISDAAKENSYKEISRENVILLLSGKRYNAVKTTYRSSSEKRLKKNHLILITRVNSEKRVWKDAVSGTLLKEEIKKHIVQKTVHQFSPEEILNLKESRTSEIVELVK